MDQTTINHHINQWRVERDKLAELRSLTDCRGDATICGCEDTGENDSCRECGVHSDTYDQMLACLDAAEVLIAAIAQHK